MKVFTTDISIKCGKDDTPLDVLYVPYKRRIFKNGIASFKDILGCKDNIDNITKLPILGANLNITKKDSSVIYIFTDGGSINNFKDKDKPSAGSMEYYIYDENKKLITHYSSYKDNITNNEAELLAVQYALTALVNMDDIDLDNTSIVISSDSQYTIKGMSEWIYNWQRDNWIAKGYNGKSDVKNRAIWEKLKSYIDTLDIYLLWQRGHKSTQESNSLEHFFIANNNNCDIMCNARLNDFICNDELEDIFKYRSVNENNIITNFSP